jgi:hypothetical protein
MPQQLSSIAVIGPARPARRLGIADQLAAPLEPHRGQPARHRQDLDAERLVVRDRVGEELLEQRDAFFRGGQRGCGHGPS